MLAELVKSLSMNYTELLIIHTHTYTHKVIHIMYFIPICSICNINQILLQNYFSDGKHIKGCGGQVG